MLKRRYVDRGMHLEFRHPEYRTPIVTSPIREIRECARLSQPEIAAHGGRAVMVVPTATTIHLVL
jgi:hypothetical protein